MPNVESWPSQSMEGKGTDYPHIEQVEDDEQIQLSLAHKEYLLARHGTLELYPMPSQDDLDPLNWPKWKVCGSCSCSVRRSKLLADSSCRNTSTYF